jgi:putative ubiquitin-RnfH superfamily antitoxin RatB of RatAB toxin-antitoxin module
MIRVELVRARPHRCESSRLELADGADLAAALQASGWRLDAEFTGLAVFGQVASPATLLRDGDRIELLRGLTMEPQQARRLRANRAKGGRR